MAHFKCISCSTSFDEEIFGIVYCPECGAVQPLPPTLTDVQKGNVYNQAIAISNRAKTAANLEDVVYIFEQLGDYLDSRHQAARCEKRLSELKKDEIYTKALQCMEKESIRGYKQAIELFAQIPNWRNASFKSDEANAKLATLLEKRQAQKDKALKITMIVCACLIAVAIISYLIIEFAVPAIRYSSALNKIEDGEYDEAYATLEDLGDYKNAKEELKKSKYNRALEYIAKGDKLNACMLFGQATGYMDAEARQIAICKTLKIQEQLSVLGIGNTVVFGQYEQDSKNAGLEKIEWIIANKKGDNVMLVSKYALEAKTFSGEATTWSKSELRKWLNNDFISSFVKNEKESLVLENTTTIYKNAEGVEHFDTCEDYVFILSENEANGLFDDYVKRGAPATNYLKTTGAYYNPDNGMAHYWLRSIAPNGEIMYVNGSGAVSQFSNATNELLGVRPAVWVSSK